MQVREANSGCRREGNEPVSVGTGGLERVVLGGRVAEKPCRGSVPLHVRGSTVQPFLLLTRASDTSEKPAHKPPIDAHDRNFWMARVPLTVDTFTSATVTSDPSCWYGDPGR